MRRSLAIAVMLFLLCLGSLYALERPRIGLVLGAGGAKGLAHIPVLKLLDELDVPVDYIVGTSIGGIIGALYAMGHTGAEIEKITAGLNWDMLFRDLPPRSQRPYFNKKDDGKYQLDLVWDDWFPSAPQGLIFGQNIFQMLSVLTFSYATERDFDRLPVPFRCVAVDLVTGNQVILGEGSLALALRATMAIPTVFSPVKWGDQLLVDGGLLNSLPVDVAREMGADIVIAVDLTTPLGGLESLDSANRILSQSILLVEHEHRRDNAADADMLIQPDMTGLGAMDFFSPEKRTEIKEQGEAAAQEAREELLRIKERYSLSREERSIREARKDLLTIGELSVMGNERLSQEFILSQLDMLSGEQVSVEKINQKVQALYALGYFEQIHYEINQLFGEEIAIMLIVREHPSGKLRLGIRYDNLHKLVGIAGLDFANVLIAGLRFENELQVFGLTRIQSRLYFPSRTLNLPVYPLLEVQYRNIPTRIFDGEGDRVASYNERAWNLDLGIGLLPAKWLNAEITFRMEEINLRPTTAFPDPDLLPDLKDSLRQIAARFTLDTLDHVPLPNQGVKIEIFYEGSFKELSSDLAYDRLEASLDSYLAFTERHTGRLFVFFGRTRGEIPFYKYFNLGRPQTFVGMRYDQLFGSQMEVLRGEYRFRYNSFLNFSLMGNVAFDFAQEARPDLGNPVLWGCGAAAVVDSPIGTVEVIYGLGSRSLSQPGQSQSVLYVTLGTRF
jgi:NTE family protein